MTDLIDDGTDEVLELARRARAGAYPEVARELAVQVRSGPSLPARLGAAVALTDILVWDDGAIPDAASIAETSLALACKDPRRGLVDIWHALVPVVVAAQVHHGVPARPRLIALAERARNGAAHPGTWQWLVRQLRPDVPEVGAPAPWRSHRPPAARQEPMARIHYAQFQVGPPSWTEGRVRSLWALLTGCREGPEVADALLAEGFDPGGVLVGWRWLIGHFREAGDDERARWALRNYLERWADDATGYAVLPRELPLYLWTRPLLDAATRRSVLTGPVGPPERRAGTEWVRRAR